MRSFGNYMQEWLYGEKGYYRKALIGQKGDFYTSVSLSKFF
ncbi:class I SAM-dependent methyltransferase, partial [Helicobacter pylori]|nr:class I SAM-dependent methyltransferase [Helicobacter pylori]